MYDLAIHGGTIVSSAGEWRADVGLQGGRIAAIVAPGSLGPSRETIDASGKHVLPGLVDPHVHLRDPGFTHKEDFRSGTMAAAAGGLTTVMAIPNTNPPLTSPRAFQAAVQAGTEKAVVDFAIFAGAGITDPESITAFAGSPIIGYDMYDDPYEYGTGHWIELFRRVQPTGLPLCFYVNDNRLRMYHAKALEAQGAPAYECWVGSTPGTLEVLCMGRVMALAAQLGVPVVLRSVTTPDGLAFVRQMRRAYPEARVTVETCVHYLFLTKDDLAAMGTRAHMGPPLRPAAEVPALWQAVRDGTVDYIGTDHAPHTPEEKAQVDLFRSPPGIIGFETVLPLLLTARAQGRLRLTDIVRLCCEAPARTYGIFPRKGAIAVGSDADLVLVDLTEQWRIDASRFYSRGERGPFDGWEVTGRPRTTIVRGQVVMADGIVTPATTGQLITPEKGGA